jgi:hypothetical protein
VGATGAGVGVTGAGVGATGAGVVTGVGVGAVAVVAAAQPHVPGTPNWVENNGQ